jgi:predicted DCC family thiol-disulfide oxidoreductase YuxK
MSTAPTGKAIIYDGECPLCAAYTRLFVRLGILNPSERIAFSELRNQEFIPRMDSTRQGNEIPLVDLNGGKTIYGVDALIFLLGKKWKWIKTIGNISVFHFFLTHFYATISYNRRIILAKKFRKMECSCAPAFHMGYRFAFIFIGAIFSFLITWLFGNAIAKEGNFPNENAGWKMEAICGTGWLVTILFALLFMKKNRIDYFGHLAVLEIIGVTILLPSILLAPFLGFSGIIFCLISVLFSSACMLRGHIRRVRIMGESQYWTAIWFCSLQITALAWSYIFFTH